MFIDNLKIKEEVKKFPDGPGVYLMKDDAGKIIYIGKATSLRRRVGSYFSQNLSKKTEKLVENIKHIEYREAGSVMEALILEANLIELYKPRYNIKLKDDKYFVNIIITKEVFPRLLIARASDRNKRDYKYLFGPYTSKKDAKKVVDVLVKIFFSGHNKKPTENLYRQYYVKGYSSGKLGNVERIEYLKSITYIKNFLEGKKDGVIRQLEREMKRCSEEENFEMAAKIRNQIFALRHIRDVVFMNKEDLFLDSNTGIERIEGYDISNISGRFAVGSMVVFSRGKSDKDEYRKFKMRTMLAPNDTAMMQEMLTRRFSHKDWRLPSLIVIDGGIGHVNLAKTVLKKYAIKIPIVGIAKGPDRKGEKLFFSGAKGFVFPDIELIKKVRDESHRFAVSYHRKLRSKEYKFY